MPVCTEFVCELFYKTESARPTKLLLHPPCRKHHLALHKRWAQRGKPKQGIINAHPHIGVVCCERCQVVRRIGDPFRCEKHETLIAIWRCVGLLVFGIAHACRFVVTARQSEFPKKTRPDFDNFSGMHFPITEKHVLSNFLISPKTVL